MSNLPHVEHKPYVPDSESPHELTLPAIFAGVILGILFGASSLYLVLKVGLTVSASIPVAVLSITLFRFASRVFGIRNATILENNIVQTTGSAGESIAFGVGVTMPALMILGFEMEASRVMLVAVLGGLLGILMMIPLRRAFIVHRHKELVYPEGTACAQVLIAGDKGGAGAALVFVGFIIAFVFQAAFQAFKFFKEEIVIPLWNASTGAGLKQAQAGTSVEPALLGVGYIIGPRIASVMMAGGVLADLVFVPAIAFFAGQSTEVIYPGKVPIAQMDTSDIRGAYVLYIGAGAVAAGGIIGMIRALPLIFGSIASGLRDLGGRTDVGSGKPVDPDALVPRTQRDLPLWVVGAGSLALVGAVWASPSLQMNLLGAVLIVVFGFLFVTVSSRLTGEIGSSSNPISGMTVATLLLTCLVFLAMGWTSPADTLTALSVAAVVCIAASNGGTTSQDLKTGYLVGATPKAQQYAILIGALTSAMVVGLTLLVLNEAGSVYTQDKKFVPDLTVPANLLSTKSDNSVRTRTVPQTGEVLRVWHVSESQAAAASLGAGAGEYLVDETGKVKYFVDPAINGQISKRDDGTDAPKYKAPKARLMSLIIDGVLSQKLPWTLVLLGVLIAVVLELCKVPSLPFAVGVYLPLPFSFPVFLGGAARWVADKMNPLPESEADTGPGSLLATGFIAGGTIAGVFAAFTNLVPRLPAALAVGEHLPEAWKESNLPAGIAFASLIAVLVYFGSRRKPAESGPIGIAPDSKP